MDFHIGCPVWSFKGWVGNFYPEGTKPKEFLHEYARRLTTVEGNTTFYAVPTRETVEGWAAEMPETFRFCPKVPKSSVTRATWWITSHGPRSSWRSCVALAAAWDRCSCSSRRVLRRT